MLRNWLFLSVIVVLGFSCVDDVTCPEAAEATRTGHESCDCVYTGGNERFVPACNEAMQECPDVFQPWLNCITEAFESGNTVCERSEGCEGNSTTDWDVFPLGCDEEMAAIPEACIDL